MVLLNDNDEIVVNFGYKMGKQDPLDITYTYTIRTNIQTAHRQFEFVACDRYNDQHLKHI